MKQVQAIGFILLTMFSLFASEANAFTILCIESDGTITLELAGDDCCFTGNAPGELSENSGISPESSTPCDSCVDIPIPHSWNACSLSSPKKSDSAKVQFALPVFSFVKFEVPAHVRVRSKADTSTSLPSYYPSITVLRI